MTVKAILNGLRLRFRSFSVPLVALAVAAASLAAVHELAAVSQAAAHDLEPVCDTGDTPQFSDIVVYEYGADYIWCARALGLTAGRADGSFGPGDSLTGAELAVFSVRLWRDVLGRDCPEPADPLTDLDEGHWAEVEIACLHGLGLTDGVSEIFDNPTAVLSAASITRTVAGMLDQADHRPCGTSSGHRGDDGDGGDTSSGGGDGGDDISAGDHTGEGDGHGGSDDGGLAEAAACLARLNIAPNSVEASSPATATRAQMAVYLIGAWHHMVGGGQPPPPPALDGSEAQQPADGSGTPKPGGYAGSQSMMTFDEALLVAERLAPHIKRPGACGHLPLDRPGWMPNARRAYRSGIHQGVDIACSRGSDAVAALDGHVVVAVGDYENATTEEYNAILQTANVLGATPAYTLIMLYGNYVVIDHGPIYGVGHVVTVYIHLDAVDGAVRPGRKVTAGQPVGRIGNSGTAAAAAGQPNGNVHLHWEIHVNGQYLGAGFSVRDTRAVYRVLFGLDG